MITVRDALLAGLHLLALSAIVVAQPLLNLLATSPEFFVAHGAGRTEILLVVAGLVLLLPSLVVALVWVARLIGPRAGATALTVAVGALAALLALQVLKQLGGGRAVVLLPVSTIGGVVLAVAYRRFAPVRTFTTLLSLAIVAVPATFLTRPAYKRLLVPSAEAVPVDRPAPARAVPVVMLVLDEVPLVSLLDAEGRIDPALYPNFAMLARQGTWFRNATTVSDYTRWALPSIVTGQSPRPDAAPAAADHPDSVFTLLARTHRVEGLEAVTRLCPERVCGPPADPLGTRLAQLASDLWIVYQHIVLPDDMKSGLPNLTGDWANFGAAASARARRRTIVEQRRAETRRGGGNNLRDRSGVARSFIERISASDPQPTFYFLHTMLPHTPHVLLPSGQMNGTRATPAVLELPKALPGKYKDAWTDDEWVLAVSYQRHLLQLAYVDEVIGSLVRRLQQTGLYDRTLVVVLADHGTVFRPGFPRRDFTDATAAEIVRVPLIVKFPLGSPEPAGPILDLGGQRVSDRNVETTDVVPTVADVLGVEVPWETAGVSLLAGSRPERPSKVLYYDFARQTRTFDRRGPDLDPAVRRKLALFGDANNRYRVPKPPRFRALIGRPLAELRVVDDGGSAEVDYRSEFDAMDATADPVPFDVAGRLLPRPRRGGDPIYVALAVNGTVHAVTRTWLHEPGEWLATPPLDAWRGGTNDLQVFVVDDDGTGPRLHRCVVRQGRSR